MDLIKMSGYVITQQDFLTDVKDHGMEILVDNEVYRHIKFSRGGSSVYRFDLITWPGHLCYTGDMGTYTFSRLRDMFEFFATEDFYGKYPINPGYWGEKLTSIDKYSSFEEFSMESFIKQIWTYVGDRILDTPEYEIISRDIEENLIPNIEEAWNYEQCINLVSEYKFFFKGEKRPFKFIDFWDYDFKEYTQKYIWACFAIAWGIKKYNEEKKSETNSDASV